MTAGQFSEVDLDRLADFVGGALDGTPDEAEVRRLVRDDPAWSQAYAELAPALAAVREQLAGWGAAVVEMPPAVTDRMTTALAATGQKGPDKAGPAGVASPPHTVHPTGRAGDAAAGPPPGRTVRRWRWPRMSRPVLVFALVAAVVGGGVGLLRQHGGPQAPFGSGVNNDAATTAASGGRGEIVRAPSAVGPVVSGTDYDAVTLARAAALADQRAAGPNRTPVEPGLGPGAQTKPDVPPAGLARLAEPAELETCLRAVSVVHGVAPLTVQLVDLAAYRGEPAVVVVFTDAVGARWSWVSGPGCGLPTMGADTRYSSRVG